MCSYSYRSLENGGQFKVQIHFSSDREHREREYTLHASSNSEGGSLPSRYVQERILKWFFQIDRWWNGRGAFIRELTQHFYILPQNRLHQYTLLILRSISGINQNSKHFQQTLLWVRSFIGPLKILLLFFSMNLCCWYCLGWWGSCGVWALRHECKIAGNIASP